MSRYELTLRSAAKRRNAIAPIDRTPTDAFKWAWEKLEGWGDVAADTGAYKVWNYTSRIDRAQRLAWYAINAPVWTAPARKRWPAIEG